MTDQMKQARDEKARTYGYNNAIYIDKAMLNKEGYQYLEEKPAKDFKEGTDWYRNNVWHPASEKPADIDDPDRDILIVTMGPEYYGSKLRTWNIFSYMSWDLFKARAGEFKKWAYLEDLLPDTKGGKS